MMIWKEPVDLAGLESSKKVGLEFVRNHPSGFYALNVVRSGLAIPDLSLQRKAAEISKLVDPHLLGTVIVLPGENSGLIIQDQQAYNQPVRRWPPPRRNTRR